MFSAMKLFAHLGEISEPEMATYVPRQFAVASFPQPFIININGNRQNVVMTTVVNEK